MKLKIPCKILIIVLLIFVFTEPKSKELGKFNDWTAYAEGEGKNLACLAVSKPKKQKVIIKEEERFLLLLHIYLVRINGMSLA